MKKVFDLTGKIAIVTGSTSGIGVGIAEVLAESGAHVVVTGRRAEKGEGIAAAIRDAGGKSSFHTLDITDESSIQALFDDTVSEFGKLDILINNAANVGLPDGNIADMTAKMWDDVFASDLRGTFLACKYAIPYMQKNGGGSIVNTSSTAAIAGNLGYGAYGPAKAGVDNLTKNIAYQYGKDNIRCNAIQPGLIVTPENDSLVSPAFREIFLNEIEVNRYGNPRDIGYMALFFAADESSFITSQIITVDGGMWHHAPQNTGIKNLMAQMG